MQQEKTLQYKELSLSISSPVTADVCGEIDDFNRRFRPDEIRIIAGEKTVRILVREIDTIAMRAAVHEICGESPSLLHQVCEEIESIGSYGLHSGKRRFVDYNKERKVKNRAKKEENRGKYYYARGNKFRDENNEFPSGLLDKVLCGDSAAVLKKLPDNCVDLVFTSPPYNFGLEYSQTQDDHYWRRYFDKLFSVFDECIRVLKYGGRIVVNIQPLYSDYIPSHHIISNYFINRKMIWKGEIMWEKNNYNCKYTAWGSWKSPSNPYLKYSWEFIEVFCKGSLKKSGDRDKIDIAGDDFKKWVYGKWSIAPERRMKEFDHPAMFPEALAQRVLQLFSYREDVVLDPFAGAGTTCAVSKMTGRHYLGIDISGKYCEKSEERLKNILL